MGNTKKKVENGDQGQGQIYSVPKHQKGQRLELGNVTENNSGALQTQRGTRPSPGNWVWRNKLEFWYSEEMMNRF